VPISLRLRLAIWYAGLLALILLVTSVLSYSYHGAAHYEDVDRSLVATAIHVLSELPENDLRSSVQDGLALPPVDEFAAPDVYVRLYDAGGQLLASSPNAGRQPEADPRLVSSTPQLSGGGPLDWIAHTLVSARHDIITPAGGFLSVAESAPEGRTRLYALPMAAPDGAIRGYLETGVSMERLDQSMDRLRMLLIGMSAVGLLAALLGGWAVAGSALRPVSAMADTARAIALSRGFSRRLPHLGRRDELGQLASTFNEMLASLEEAYRAQQRFVADASHELRAPLTAIQGNLELLERAPHLPEDAKAEALSYLRLETGRLSRLVTDLLSLAHADAGQSMRQEIVELDRLLLEVFREARMLARGQKLAVLDLDQIQVQGDPDRLKQLLLILVDNAIKYTPESGQVRLTLRREAGAAMVTVSDTGIGIDPEDLPHLFDRFYRADKARARDQGGTGLGLAIAKWIAERHGGHITVESAPGSGTTVSVQLPVVSSTLPRF
jgi:two-component system, OmpR family, sensor kinase